MFALTSSRRPRVPASTRSGSLFGRLCLALTLMLATAPALAEGHGGPPAQSPSQAALQPFVSLVLVVDTSSSISEAEYGLQKQSYVRVLSDPEMAPWLSDVAVAVVEFGSSAHLVVPFASPRDAAARYARTRRAVDGQTNIRAGLDLALGLLAERGGQRIIDISGDGPDNVNGEPCGSLAPVIEAARAQMIQVNALAILNEPPHCAGNVGEWYQNELQGLGFVIRAETFEDFRDALERKLRLEVAAR
jgi:hypothetical protein